MFALSRWIDLNPYPPLDTGGRSRKYSPHPLGRGIDNHSPLLKGRGQFLQPDRAPEMTALSPRERTTRKNNNAQRSSQPSPLGDRGDPSADGWVTVEGLRLAQWGEWRPVPAPSGRQAPRLSAT